MLQKLGQTLLSLQMMFVDKTLIVAAENTHIFEGLQLKAGSDMEYLVADNDKANSFSLLTRIMAAPRCYSWVGWDMTEQVR